MNVTRVRNVCRSHDAPDLFHGLQVRTETSMATEDFLVDDCSDGQTVEAVRKCLPKFYVVSAFAWDGKS